MVESQLQLGYGVSVPRSPAAAAIWQPFRTISVTENLPNLAPRPSVCDRPEEESPPAIAAYFRSA
jgi:hypothetical protein